MSSELERTSAFDEALPCALRRADRPLRFGRAYFNDSHLRVWFLNGPVDGTKEVDPGELAAEAELLLHTDAGQAHRRCDVPHGAVGARLEPFFRRIGWKIEQDV